MQTGRVLDAHAQPCTGLGVCTGTWHCAEVGGLAEPGVKQSGLDTAPGMPAEVACTQETAEAMLPLKEESNYTESSKKACR